MSMLLFVGGTKHGQVGWMDPDKNVVRVPIPAEEAHDPATGGILLGQSVTYVRRTVGTQIGQKRVERDLMVDETVGPDQAIHLLTEVLLFAWCTEPERPGSALGWPPAEMPAGPQPEHRMTVAEQSAAL